MEGRLILSIKIYFNLNNNYVIKFKFKLERPRDGQMNFICIQLWFD